MRKIFYTKRMFLLSASTLLLAACGGDNDSEIEEAPTEEPVEQPEETPDPNENLEDDNSEPADPAEDEEEVSSGNGENTNEGQEDTELSEEEAVERVRAYIEEEEDVEADDFSIMIEEREEGEYSAQVFTYVSGGEDDEMEATRTMGWYTVDRQTGEVRDTFEEDTDGFVSEIVSMDEEERESHHRNMAVSEENLMDQVFDNLLLPGVHENTTYYEGRVGPDESVRVEFPDAEDMVDRTTTDLDVDEEGYFSIDLSEYDFQEGEVITFRITGGYPQEQVFEIPVHEAKDGMEEIHVRE